jgi:hypothetical protein
MTSQAQPQHVEPNISLAELVAMRRIPDAHAFAFRLYVGDTGERPLSEWVSLYEEFKTKPTDMPKEKWHEQFVQSRKER